MASTPSSTDKLITGQRILCTLGNLAPGYANLPLPALRRFYDSYDQPWGSGSRADVSSEDRLIPLGEQQIPIRIYRPVARAPKLTMVYFHGGGYVIGGFKSHHGFCSLLAGRAGYREWCDMRNSLESLQAHITTYSTLQLFLPSHPPYNSNYITDTRGLRSPSVLDFLS